MHEQIQHVLDAADGIVLGKRHVLRLALACLLARGHLLIEDVPGVGKTTLAHALARLLGLRFQRVQFTSDLLPADIIGVSVYDRDSATLPLPARPDLRPAGAGRRGQPRHAQDPERAARGDGGAPGHPGRRDPPAAGRPSSSSPPRTRTASSAPSRCPSRSSIASSCASTWAIRTATPSAPCSRATTAATCWPALEPVIRGRRPSSPPRARRATVHVSDAIIDYVQAIVIDHPRLPPSTSPGCRPAPASPSCARRGPGRCWTAREHVLPEDVQAVLPAVASHRLESRDGVAGRIAHGRRRGTGGAGTGSVTRSRQAGTASSAP